MTICGCCYITVKCCKKSVQHNSNGNSTTGNYLTPNVSPRRSIIGSETYSVFSDTPGPDDTRYETQGRMSRIQYTG